MPRRSSRLLASGYYQPSEDNEYHHTISYKETPIKKFNKWRKKRGQNVLSFSQTTGDSLPAAGQLMKTSLCLLLLFLAIYESYYVFSLLTGVLTSQTVMSNTQLPMTQTFAVDHAAFEVKINTMMREFLAKQKERVSEVPENLQGDIKTLRTMIETLDMAGFGHLDRDLANLQAAMRSISTLLSKRVEALEARNAKLKKDLSAVAQMTHPRPPLDIHPSRVDGKIASLT